MSATKNFFSILDNDDDENPVKPQDPSQKKTEKPKNVVPGKKDKTSTTKEKNEVIHEKNKNETKKVDEGFEEKISKDKEKYRKQPLKDKGVSGEPHPLDRRSGTGMGKEMKKEGGGRRNWGNYKNEYNEYPENQYEKKWGQKVYVKKAEGAEIEKKDEKENNEKDKNSDAKKDDATKTEKTDVVVKNEEEKKEPEIPSMTLTEYYEKFNIHPKIEEDKKEADKKKSNVDENKLKAEGLHLMKTKEAIKKEEESSKNQKKSKTEYNVGPNKEHADLLGFYPEKKGKWDNYGYTNEEESGKIQKKGKGKSGKEHVNVDDESLFPKLN